MSSIRPSIVDEHTPVDKTPNEDPFEMLSKKLDGVAADTKVAILEAREAKQITLKTYDLQLELNEHCKKIELDLEKHAKKDDRRLMAVEAYHLGLPWLSIFLAAIAILLALKL